jgi:hypothetical protein
MSIAIARCGYNSLRLGVAARRRGQEQHMGLAEAAALAGVHRRTLIYAIEHGRLEAEQVSGVWITTRSAVEAWQRHAKHRPGPAKGTKRQEHTAAGEHDG